LVFFIKNRQGEYVVVNQTLVERCGKREKAELIGHRVDELFPGPLASGYRAQDEAVFRNGTAIRNQLELHFFASGEPGWCLTNNLPLRDRAGAVVGLVGISKDLPAANERSRDYARIARVVRHIQANFAAQLRVRQLAKLAGLSHYQLEQRMRAIFQITAGQFIQKVRLENAMRWLQATETPIAQIALDCGYSDQSAFARQFRRTTGLPPSDFRAASR
jgi:AraC-like DNA-binding protein